MSPDLARLHVSVERERRKARADAEWVRHLEAVKRQERRNSRRHRPTQGEGRGLFNIPYE